MKVLARTSRTYVALFVMCSLLFRQPSNWFWFAYMQKSHLRRHLSSSAVCERKFAGAASHRFKLCDGVPTWSAVPMYQYLIEIRVITIIYTGKPDQCHSMWETTLLHYWDTSWVAYRTFAPYLVQCRTHCEASSSNRYIRFNAATLLTVRPMSHDVMQCTARSLTALCSVIAFNCPSNEYIRCLHSTKIYGAIEDLCKWCSWNTWP